MKLSSAVLSYLNVHSTLNFTRTFFIFLNINTYQTSKEQILNFIRSSHRKVFWKHMSQSKLLGLQLYFTGIFEDFGHIFLICSKKSIKILKVRKIFRYVTPFYQYFFVSDKICYHKTNSGNLYN